MGVPILQPLLNEQKYMTQSHKSTWENVVHVLGITWNYSLWPVALPKTSGTHLALLRLVASRTVVSKSLSSVLDKVHSK